ncbi:uncharacterized protein BO88DRAFT_461601 [Aspergillus vadensis CBS 113365]|uniref:Uncharacterized protein n=1 Tax=Aspergillus vadensis (strain CBS 113365 / IMI 142717 / IBT 24658) TaxID=1448311 RepID=A0A319BU19_ASPVC|nr:hypothetical protein BO88DRAFT_461601 [Aspergillus vadensis CBS 113365]PYH69373.1 hypothetical protein BO88DRAFT_461601 [Aspergillus vadensis CBS 113365]
MKSLFLSTVAGLVFAAAASPMLAASSIDHHASNSLKDDCDRACMATIVDQVLASMVVHNPYTLPMAAIYQATENSHPAALGMMTAWRIVTEAGPPSLLAIDTTQGSAYFALDVSEGSDTERSVLRGRVKVVNQEITELELFINRYRGDHGFSFSAAELPSNYEALMSPPGNRTKASRATLTALSEALFATSSNMSVRVDANCQFTEIGWKVIDTGTYNNETTTPLSCSWPSDHPTDENARVGLVIDEELGFVVTSGMIQGKVYPYQNVSAFIPDAMTSSQEAQDVWLNEVKALGVKGLLAPTEATGETLEVLQYYNDALQAMQINVYMSGPNMTSTWL